MKYEYVICHYAEIGLKGKNRKFFEEKLVENIKKALPGNSFQRVRRISGRILIELIEEKVNETQIKNSLKDVFGIAHFSFAVGCEQKIESIKEKAAEILKDKKFKSFRIETQRGKKDFPLDSQQINERVGEYVLRKLKTRNPKLKVNLKKPKITCFIEIVEKYAFLYLRKIPGPGGLPVSVSGKAISLLSGGIDSPVASFYGQRRGIEIIFLHFTSFPFTKQSSVEKVKKIVEILNRFQFQAKLYLVPFTEIQKEILLKTKAKLRVILYRRFMFRIAEVLAEKVRARALITGESVGQVASQTLENIGAIEEAVKLPVLRPLIGLDKKDIINEAGEIGTFDVSILPGEDCCSRFLPKHPETRANLAEVKREENKLNIGKLIEEAIKKTKVVRIINHKS